MFVHYRTQGLIIRKDNRAEADQLFSVYTRDFGKLEILGKAIRKISSKLRPGTEIFCLSEIEFIQGKNYKTLTDSILIEKFGNIGKDLKKMQVAYKISEILNDLIRGQEPDEKIWPLLKETFRKLNKAEAVESKTEMLYHYFFWNLVSKLGYRPLIKDCTVHGKKINCDIVKIIKVILRKDWHILSRLKILPIHLKLLKNFSKWYKIRICE